jgi:hypothetical protein
MMNERIKELARDAGLLVHNPDGVPTKLEKFAELIVEECRYVMDCNKGGDQNPAWNQALWETSEKIKQHFGINSSDNIRAGAEIHSDKGYSESTQEKYEEAKQLRERK